VCTSEVQTSEAVVLTTASFAPGSGIGLSTTDLVLAEKGECLHDVASLV